MLRICFCIFPLPDLVEGCGAGQFQFFFFPHHFYFKNCGAVMIAVADYDITSSHSVLPVGFYRVTGSGKNACEKRVVKAFSVIVETDSTL